MTSRKRIIISIVAIVVIAGLTTASLVTIKRLNAPKKDTSTTVKKDTPATVPDVSANYGACDLVTSAQIQTALGATAANLSTGYDTGKGAIGNGDLAQNCVYGLHSAVTSINEKMLTDSFYTTVYLYKDKVNKAGDTHAYDNAVVITGIGDTAGFFSNVNKSLGTTEYSVRVDVGLQAFSFAIRQTTDKNVYDAKTAQVALTALAKQIDFSKFTITK